MIQENKTNSDIRHSWWHGIIACPYCGSDIRFEVDELLGGFCIKCGQVFTIENNVLQWPAPQEEKRRYGLHDCYSALKFYLNPLTSPLSPLIAFSHYKTEQYYERTLHDRALANDWQIHYISDLNLSPGALILDHGCGRGRNIGLLNQLGFKVCGQEMTMFKWWGLFPDSFFQVVAPSFEHLPWTTSSFDMVLDIEVLQHLNFKQLELYGKEIFRVLRPGGFWLILEANSLSYNADRFRKYYGRLHSLDEVQLIMRKIGFEEIDHSFESFYSPIFPSLINYIRKNCFGSLNLSDFDSHLAAKIKPQKRGLWLLRLNKTDIYE